MATPVCVVKAEALAKFPDDARGDAAMSVGVTVFSRRETGVPFRNNMVKINLKYLKVMCSI